MSELVALFLLLTGVAFVLIAAIGVFRLPDPFLRMHAATKAGTLGAGLVLLGVAVAFADTGTWVVAALTILFLLATLPISAHLLGRAAYVSGAKLWEGTARDDLQDVLPRQSDQSFEDRLAEPSAPQPNLGLSGPRPSSGADAPLSAPDAARR
jgi:multicomponent Na+:H+ antiporter subunit G